MWTLVKDFLPENWISDLSSINVDGEAKCRTIKMIGAMHAYSDAEFVASDTLNVFGYCLRCSICSIFTWFGLKILIGVLGESLVRADGNLNTLKVLKNRHSWLNCH